MRTIVYISSVIATSAIMLSSCKNDPTQVGTLELESPVTVMELTPSSIKKYTNTAGTALACASVELKSEMSGDYNLQRNRTTGQPYKLGDKVKKGDILVTFVDREYELATAIETKKMSKDIAEQDYVKQQALYEKGGITLTELRNAEVKAMSAVSDYENALIRQSKMQIKAPFNGVIVALPFYTNGVSQASGISIATIMDYSKMYLEINLPESALTSVKESQPVAVTHYTIPDDTIKGYISQLSPAISSETRTFKGMITIENDKLLLRPGMFVKADIVVDQANATIVVPKEAVLNNRNRRYVYVVEKNIAKVRNLRVGIEDADNIEVIDGLNMGDQLVIRGFETLREDSKVKVQK